MNITAQRTNIVHRILDVSDINLLNEIELLLNKNVFTYTTSGKPITASEYKNHIENIMILSDSGESGYTTEEAKHKIQRK